ncbi:MAG: hypothetical protein NTW87_11405 [Planctomycetota bacterium]|nr:hypothetical protein [Planctomycetota bacterium]
MATLVGVTLVCGGAVALLVAVVSRCGAYGRRAVVLFSAGVLALCVGSSSRPVVSFGTHSDRLLIAQRERNALAASLRYEVLPLIERCTRDLQHSSPALPEDEARIARQHAQDVLSRTESQRAEHERAIAELDAAIGIIERERMLTYVKPVERSRAMARVVFTDLGSTTEAVLARRRAR